MERDAEELTIKLLENRRKVEKLQRISMPSSRIYTKRTLHLEYNTLFIKTQMF